MAGLGTIFTDDLHDNLKPWHAVFPIGDPIELGDYGVMDGDQFIRVGSIGSDFDLKPKVRTDTTIESSLVNGITGNHSVRPA